MKAAENQSPWMGSASILRINPQFPSVTVGSKINRPMGLEQKHPLA